jgi:DNA-binding CsgD family transcriptional regulator
MAMGQMDQLIEAIYDAALDPAGWADVMTRLQARFSTRVEALYFLDFSGRSMRSVHVGGVTAAYYRSFSDRYFTRDNPWTRADPLHRPGVVRTDERLARYFKDAQILRKSEYYNDWMRPQGLEHTLGTTLLTEGDTIANLTLLRPADAGGYLADEVLAFEQICGHLRRALQVAMRLETATVRTSTTREALDRVRYGAAFVDLRGALLHCNHIAETLLRKGDGLTVRNGRLVAVDPRDRRRLDSLLHALAHDAARPGRADLAHVTIRRARNDRPLTVSAIRLSTRRSLFVAPTATILVLIVDPSSVTPIDVDLLRQRYDLTRAEARLALALAAGHGLRRAAEEVKMTYETARWYLKILFQKTDTNRQAALVARLLQDLAVPLSPSA